MEKSNSDITEYIQNLINNIKEATGYQKVTIIEDTNAEYLRITWELKEKEE